MLPTDASRASPAMPMKPMRRSREALDFMSETSKTKTCNCHHSPSAGYRRLQRSGNSEARVFDTDTASGGVAVGGAEELGVVVPGPAAEDAETAVARCHRSAVRRRARIAVLVAVLDPLPDVAVHIVETEGVAGERPHVERLLAIEALRAAAVFEIGIVVRLLVVDRGARGKRRVRVGSPRHAARRVLPFRLRHQSVGLARLLR